MKAITSMSGSNVKSAARLAVEAALRQARRPPGRHGCVRAAQPRRQSPHVAGRESGGGRMSAPAVLDVCCGGRMMWFDKRDSRAIFGVRARRPHALAGVHAG